MEKEHVLAIFREAEALLDGHFQLTSGLHSGQYFQCAKVLQYPRFAETLCGVIVGQFRTRTIDVVIAPALGGIVVAQEVGRQLGVKTMFAERKDGAMQLRRGFEITPGERVLVCEDVVTTGGSVVEVIDIVKKHGALTAGVGYLVDRSGGTVKFAIDESGLQCAVLHMDIKAYNQAECPLCKQGIPLVRPGSRANQ